MYKLALVSGNVNLLEVIEARGMVYGKDFLFNGKKCIRERYFV